MTPTRSTPVPPVAAPRVPLIEPAAAAGSPPEPPAERPLFATDQVIGAFGFWPESR